MKMKILFVTTALIAAFALFWGFNPAKGTDVETVLPAAAPAIQAVYATGTVAASRMVPVSPRIAARLVTLYVDEGAKVTAGQILAQLEDTDIRENLKQFEAQLTLAQKEFERAEKLWKTRAISKTGYDQAQAALNAAQANTDRTKAELGYLQLIAPEDGTVIRRDGEIGQIIMPATSFNAASPVFWINAGDKIRIETEVDEEDIGLVRPGQKVLVRADAFPGQTFNGQVQSITPKGDPVARSYRVRVAMEEGSQMMIGMTAETNIITQEKDSAMMVPAGAVKEGAVLTLKDGKAVQTQVQTGIKTPDAVEILQGVAAGEAVVATYNSTLLEKDRLRGKPKAWEPVKAE